jgi:C_GCAxxG_C_C family probable redox protein
LIQQIAEKYIRLRESGLNWIKKEEALIRAVKKAYERGFQNELSIRGCAQCAIRALGEATGKVEKNLFQAASGLSGGIAITGDGSCGGYTGGVLYMGSYAGRRMDYLEDGDKVVQYQSYDMAQKLHDRFMETYGSVTCSEIHKEIFGTAYSLRTKAVRNDFEEAGGHLDKCTTVIAMASSWVMELLIEEGFES